MRTYPACNPTDNRTLDKVYIKWHLRPDDIILKMRVPLRLPPSKEKDEVLIQTTVNTITEIVRKEL